MDEKGGICEFYCETCNYTACDRYNLNRHFLTNKHKKIVFMNNESNEIISEDVNNTILHKCKCGKTYNHKSNLMRHKKTICTFREEHCKKQNVEFSEKNIDYKDLIIMLVNENNELKKQILELSNKL